MDIEFHYYITYLISKASGFSEADSYRIAYSSQFVDDNNEEYLIKDSYDKLIYKNKISSTFDLTISKERLIKIYACFHFLPGDVEGLDKNLSSTSIARTITTPNSSWAKKILSSALKSHNPYLIGIASHAYVDTWAHQNFTALIHNLNSISGLLYNFIPNLGHADFMNIPDKVNETWNDYRLDDIKIINNNQRFLQACQNLFLNYAAHNKLDNVENRAAILCKQISRIINLDIGKNKRIAFYKELGKREYGMNNMPDYNEFKWIQRALFYNDKQKNWRAYENIKESDWFLFQEMISHYKNDIWQQIAHIYPRHC